MIAKILMKGARILLLGMRLTGSKPESRIAKFFFDSGYGVLAWTGAGQKVQNSNTLQD